MATARADLTAALEGKTPERTPLSLYSWMMERPAVQGLSDDWQRLVDQGLALCHHCSTVRHLEHGVENSTEERKEGSDTYTRYRKKTPVGTLQMIRRNGWHHEDWVKTPADYKIRQWIIEHTELQTCYEEFEKADAFAGDRGVAVICGSRTPAMDINLEWAGTEQFCIDVALEVPELFELFEAQKRLFIEESRLIAAGPGRYVKWFENLTIAMIGPQRYADLLVSVYNQTVPLLEASGKRVMVHYDGALAVIADLIAAAPFHMVESLTEPPEGDMLYDQCRRAWPDKVLWGNLNIELYYGPTDRLRAEVVAKRERAGKRAFAFEISEDLPATWQTTIPVVLETLRDLG
jgi:hypothetical protein